MKIFIFTDTSMIQDPYFQTVVVIAVGNIREVIFIILWQQRNC